MISFSFFLNLKVKHTDNSMKRIIAWSTIMILLVSILTGCSILSSANSLQYSSQPKIGCVTYINQATVFQTLGEHFALARYKYPDGSQMVAAMQTGDGDSPMYDGRVIGGEFVMIDTYTYETVPDKYGRSSMKTVPLLLYKDVYLKNISGLATQ